MCRQLRTAEHYPSNIGHCNTISFRQEAAFRFLLDEKTRSSLGESIAKCIETVLNSNYGEDISPVIFYAYKARFGLVKSDIISHAEEFEEILEDIFGTGIASQMINRTICLALGRQFEIDLIESGDSIATVIKRIVARADERAS